MKKPRRPKSVKVHRNDFLNTFVLSAVISQVEALGYSVRVS